MLVIFIVIVCCSSWSDGSDFRLVPFEDILSASREFSDPPVRHYSQLLIDAERGQIIVGARDALYRLNITTLEQHERAYWPATDTKVKDCQRKGQTEENCHNYINVVLSHINRLFICGTGAFSPLCSWRDIQNIGNELTTLGGEARAAYSPHGNMSAYMTSSGLYFAASPTDFQGVVPAITRSRPEPDVKTHPISTNLHDSKWLNGAQFVGSFESEKFVFFLFRETAVEYINCGKIIYARIARVCKNDEGGRTVLVNNWTTFLKARLNCSLPGDYPFYFDEIQGMTYDAEEKIVYATFTTPSNGIIGSAICAFNMSAIDTAFNGDFKYQKHRENAWERSQPTYRKHFECETTYNPHQHFESTKYQLMDSAVQPISSKPLYTVELETLTHISVEHISTKLHEKVLVMYVVTSLGGATHLKKISILTRTQTFCVIGIWSIPERILFLKSLPEKSAVFLGLPSKVLRIPTSFCKRYHSQESCANAMDPHCGWNDILGVCSTPPRGDPLLPYWNQSITECPRLQSRMDGGWSAWSSWFTCAPENGAQNDTCKCSTRLCNNPEPQGGGINCRGVSITVTNCTVHGAWTEWSAYSQCSQSCGIAVKTRFRVCGNPAPAHGGRVCVGKDREEIYCTGNPPCPQNTLPPRDGGWSAWAGWSECSTPCGGGFRLRARSCNNPLPAFGGQDCTGNNIEYETCNIGQCSDVKKLSAWTPWMQFSNDSTKSGYTEKRFKFSCKAPVADASLIKIAQAKEEERSCFPGNQCTKNGGRLAEIDAPLPVWSEWSPWSPCSRDCGGGEQQQRRTCTSANDDCEGQSIRSRICNTQRCNVEENREWSCWTEWSSCSVTCGIGIETRTRVCNKQATNGFDGSCTGTPMEQRPCEKPSCLSLQGWGEWTEWSLCDQNSQQHRQRICLMSSPGLTYCQGKSIESRMCVGGQQWENENDIPLYVARLYGESKGSVDVGIILGCCVVAFILGSILALVSTYYYQKHRRVRIPGSPHYISKQNPYVTVPLREPPKRSSSSASSGSSGYKTSSSSTPTKLFSKPPDYETATIKRNSGMNGHGVRAQLDEDKFF